MERICLDCPGPVSRKSKTGRCRRCARVHLNRSPEQRAAASAAQIKSWATTDRRDRKPDNLSAWRATEEGKRKLTELNRQRGRARTAALRAWCPPEWLRRYRNLRSRLGSVEAKRRVLSEIAGAERVQLEAMSPFQRQMEAIRRGAGIVTKQPIPARAYDFTLAGASPL